MQLLIRSSFKYLWPVFCVFVLVSSAVQWQLFFSFWYTVARNRHYLSKNSDASEFVEEIVK